MTLTKYIRFIFYMIGTLLKKIKYRNIIKNHGEDEGKKYVDKVILDWAKFTVNLLGIRLIIEGAENIPKGTFLIVSNHEGDLDIPCILTAFNRNIGFVAKKEMENVPVMSYWMKRMNCVFMDRDNIREAVKAINEGVALLKNGTTLAIFPEGTRSKGRGMGEFKKGSLKLGAKAKVPILPISIKDTFRIFEESHGLRIKKGEVKIKISQPIYTEKLTPEELKDLPMQVEKIVRNNLNEL